MAQLGSALRSGRRGHRFKSGYPDQLKGHFPSKKMPLLCLIQQLSTATALPVTTVAFKALTEFPERFSHLLARRLDVDLHGGRRVGVPEKLPVFFLDWRRAAA
jgi:hypothetical protein